MIHPLCMTCVHHCKQEESVNIVQCPQYQKRLSDDEFKDLVDRLKDMESDATDLKKRTEALIQMATIHDLTVRGDGENEDADMNDTDEEEDYEDIE